MSTSKTSAHVMISGRVQGVFFRAETREKARRLGLTGWVRNTRDGRVEAVFEGDAHAVEKMLRWCEKGPPSSRVEKVDADYAQYTGEFDSFSVRY
ncbi:MAG: acylphosphatase [Deltaproteobacteria bacterium]|nr:acylphosphatase [Deltaproteobacteria bacterium]